MKPGGFGRRDRVERGLPALPHPRLLARRRPEPGTARAPCSGPVVGFYQTIERLFKSTGSQPPPAAGIRCPDQRRRRFDGRVAPASRSRCRTAGSGRCGSFDASTRNSCAVTSASSNASCGSATGMPVVRRSRSARSRAWSGRARRAVDRDREVPHVDRAPTPPPRRSPEDRAPGSGPPRRRTTRAGSGRRSPTTAARAPRRSPATPRGPGAAVRGSSGSEARGARSATTSWCTAPRICARPPSTGTTPKETTTSERRSRPVVSKSRAANDARRQGKARARAGGAGGITIAEDTGPSPTRSPPHRRADRSARRAETRPRRAAAHRTPGRSSSCQASSGGRSGRSTRRRSRPAVRPGRTRRRGSRPRRAIAGSTDAPAAGSHRPERGLGHGVSRSVRPRLELPSDDPRQRDRRTSRDERLDQGTGRHFRAERPERQHGLGTPHFRQRQEPLRHDGGEPAAFGRRHLVTRLEHPPAHRALRSLQLRAVHVASASAITSSRSGGPTGNTTNHAAPAARTPSVKRRRSSVVPVHTPSRGRRRCARSSRSRASDARSSPTSAMPPQVGATSRPFASSRGAPPGPRTLGRRAPIRSRRRRRGQRRRGRPRTVPRPRSRVRRAGGAAPCSGGTCSPPGQVRPPKSARGSLHRLLEHRDARRDPGERDPEPLVLVHGGAIAGAQGQDRPPSRHRVEGGGLLRQDAGSAQGHARDQRADVESRLARGNGRQAARTPPGRDGRVRTAGRTPAGRGGRARTPRRSPTLAARAAMAERSRRVVGEHRQRDAELHPRSPVAAPVDGLERQGCRADRSGIVAELRLHDRDVRTTVERLHVALERVARGASSRSPASDAPPPTTTTFGSRTFTSPAMPRPSQYPASTRMPLRHRVAGAGRLGHHRPGDRGRGRPRSSRRDRECGCRRDRRRAGTRDRGAARHLLPASPVAAAALAGRRARRRCVRSRPRTRARRDTGARRARCRRRCRCRRRRAAGGARRALPRTGTHPTRPRCCRCRRPTDSCSACSTWAASGTSRHARFGANRIMPSSVDEPGGGDADRPDLVGHHGARDRPPSHRGWPPGRPRGSDGRRGPRTRPARRRRGAPRSSCRRRRCRRRASARSRDGSRCLVRLCERDDRTRSPGGRRRSSPRAPPCRFRVCGRIRFRLYEPTRT